MNDPYYRDDQVTVHAGDCIEVLCQLDTDSVDAVVTDPPYGLEFMGKAWDAIGNIGKAKNRGMGGISQKGMALPESYNADVNVKCEACGRWRKDHAARKCTCADPQFPNVKAHQARSMQEWHTAWVLECLRVLKPGGYLLAFGGSRTWHRLACAVEDAGFEVRDSIAWLYGSGYPKSLNVSKAIDKRKVGSEGVDAFKRALGRAVAASGKSRKQINTECGFTMRFDVTFDRDPDGWGCPLPTPEQYDVICRVLAMDAAGDVSQLREWPRTSMEKLYEVVGYEHRANSPAGIVGLGRGAVPVARELTAPATDAAKQWEGWGTALKPAFEPIVVARKPLGEKTVVANVLTHGTGALNIDACRVPTTDKLHGTGQPPLAHGGMNARPFHANHEAQRSEQHEAGRWPTNVVLDGEMADELDHQSGVLKSGANPTRRSSDKFRNAYGDFAGQEECVAHRGADEGGASRFFPVFRYTAKAAGHERPTANGVAHPTVKPLDLMRWLVRLVRLVTPPGGLVLDPFAGSGTTAEACIHEHMRCITIERELDYLPLIVARLTKPMAVGFDFDGAAS